MSEVVCREAAEAEVQLWVEHFGVTIDAASRDRIVRALMDGRITLDDAADTFVYRLRKPLSLADGNALSELHIAEPTTGQIRDANKAVKDEFEVAIRLLSYVTGQPLGILDRMGQRDLVGATALFGFFG